MRSATVSLLVIALAVFPPLPFSYAATAHGEKSKALVSRENVLLVPRAESMKPTYEFAPGELLLRFKENITDAEQARLLKRYG